MRLTRLANRFNPQKANSCILTCLIPIPRTKEDAGSQFSLLSPLPSLSLTGGLGKREKVYVADWDEKIYCLTKAEVNILAVVLIVLQIVVYFSCILQQSSHYKA